MTRVKWYIPTSRDDSVSVNLIFDSWVIAVQITNRLTQSGYHKENRDYGVSCWSRLDAADASQCQRQLLVLEYSWRLLARITHGGEAKHTGKSTEGPGLRRLPLFPSFLIPSSYRARVSVFRVEAGVRGLVLARQNLTKQFAPKQTTASGLLVNKQHIYF